MATFGMTCHHVTTTNCIDWWISFYIYQLYSPLPKMYDGVKKTLPEAETNGYSACYGYIGGDCNSTHIYNITEGDSDMQNKYHLVLFFKTLIHFFRILSLYLEIK